MSSYITYFALICLSDEKGGQSCSTSENINQTLKLDVTHRKWIQLLYFFYFKCLHNIHINCLRLFCNILIENLFLHAKRFGVMLT